MKVLPTSPALELRKISLPAAAPVPEPKPDSVALSSGLIGATSAKSANTGIYPAELRALIAADTGQQQIEDVAVSPALGALALVGGGLLGFLLARAGSGRRAPVPGYRPYRRYRRYRRFYRY